MNPAPWRVLFVDHAGWMGGAEENLRLLLSHLDRQKVVPLLASAAGSPLATAAEAMGVPVFPVPMARLRGRRDVAGIARDWARGVRALAALTRREKVHILHANTMRASLYAAPAARLTGARLVWHVHDIFRPGPYTWMMCLAAHGIVVISPAAARGLPAPARTRAQLIPNGIDLPRFAPSTQARRRVREEFGFGEEDFVVGSIGWIAPWKQTHLFVEVARHLAGHIPAARFLLVGDIPDVRYAGYLAEVRAAAQGKWAQRICFAGARADIPDILAGLDLLVHTAKAEPFGRVIMEAMSAGVPVVAFADGGVPDVLGESQAGVLVPPGDLPAMVKAIRVLWENPTQRRAMGLAGRARAASQFDIGEITRRLEAFYDQIMA